MTASLPSTGPLRGPHLVATVFSEADVAELATVLQDPEVYAHGNVMHAPPSDEADALRRARGYLHDGSSLDGAGNGRICYSLRLAADSALGAAGSFVGTSSIGEVHLARESAHLGWTLYAPAFWGSGTNPEAKWLLLGHCFDDCGLGRVRIQTDILNTRSQAAIARLGATREGVLRREQPREDGSWRDAVVFSILRDEWPEVSRGLQARFPRA